MASQFLLSRSNYGDNAVVSTGIRLCNTAPPSTYHDGPA